jgi:hypothetical protein
VLQTLSILANEMLFVMESALTLRRRRMAERNQKDWREPCSAVVNETDSNKLGSQVRELIKALDEGEQNWRPRIDPFGNTRAAL